ncbi:MAG: T9SS type A sorting domain-containing protein [Chitinophagales bacterium]
MLHVASRVAGGLRYEIRHPCDDTLGKHAKKGQEQLKDADFAIVLDFLNDSVSIGDTVMANIILSESGDTTDIYGLAFSINHNVEDSGSMQINFPPSFIGDEENTISLQKNLGNGRIEAAISRINQQNTGGSGVFGVLVFVMEDFLDDKKKIASEDIVFDFSEVRAVNNRGEAVSISGVGDVAVFDDTSTGIEDRVIDEALEYYPNPTHNHLYINLEGLQSTSIEIVNLQGERVLLKSINSHQKSIELSLKDLKQGVYVLQVRTKAGIIVKRVVVF